MNKQQLMNVFTPYVNQFLADGYHVDMLNISGGYSSVWGTQLHLAKGDEHAVMWMERDHMDCYSKPSQVRCRVAWFETDPGEDVNSCAGWPRDWQQHLVAEKTYYAVDFENDDWFVTSEEAQGIIEKKKARRSSRYYSTNCYDIPVTDRVLKAVRKFPGFKTVKRENVRVERLYADEPGATYAVSNHKSGKRVRVSYR